MPGSTLIRFSACLLTVLSLANCSSKSDPPCSPGDGSCASPSGGSGGARSSTAGSTSAGGMASTTGGTSSGGGMASTTGGASSTAGATSTGGITSMGGMPSNGGATAGSGGAAIVDKNGVGLAKPGDQKTQSRDYLNLGDMRLLANKWGSDELKCSTTMRVFVNNDKTFGWDFNRGNCGDTMGSKPDYPELEFGVHPFGAGSALETSPPFSSTTVLPLQIKDITTASVVIDSMAINLTSSANWNIDFEFWLSQRNPATDPNPGVYAELITFWGWDALQWPCDKTGSVTAGDKSYNLCHQDDLWADGKWRYYQFRMSGGPSNSFSGKVDVKALLNYLVGRGYSSDLWVTRFEVGSEVDDNTGGTVTFKNVTFEVNGTSKSPRFGQ